MARAWLIELRGTAEDLSDLALVFNDDQAEITRDSGRVWLRPEADFDEAAAFVTWARARVAAALRRSEIVLGHQLQASTGQVEEIDVDGRRHAHILVEGTATGAAVALGALSVTTGSRQVPVTAALGLEGFERGQLVVPATKLEVARLSPSFGVLARLLDGGINLDGLTWREFEELIADLLQQDGFAVVLGPGRDDGGKDIVATKDMGESGAFMAVWQAKKYRSDRRIQLAVVRELADTRQQEGASKGVIATTSYLSRGALDRVQRQSYQLAKVDRDDLFHWIERLERRRSGPHALPPAV